MIENEQPYHLLNWLIGDQSIEVKAGTLVMLMKHVTSSGTPFVDMGPTITN